MKSKTGFLALSLLGFGLVGIACGGSSDSGDDTSTAGTTSTTAGTGTGIGGSTSTAGTSSASGTTNNSSGTGNTTAGTNTGGNTSGGNANGGNANGGAGFMNSASCPGSAPMDGDMCMLPGAGGAGGTGGAGGNGAGGRMGGGNNNLNCAYGTTFCQCARMGNGQNAMRAWNCRTVNGGNGGNGNGGNTNGGNTNGGNANGGNANGGAGGNTAVCGDAPMNNDTCTGFGRCPNTQGCRCQGGMVRQCQ